MNSLKAAIFISTGLLITGIARPALAQNEAPSPCSDIQDEIEKRICQNPTLSADDQTLDAVWQTWIAGINAERIEYLVQEQDEWRAARSECLAEDDPDMCLQSRYEERVVILTRPRIFQVQTTIDGQDYERYSAMTPLTYVGLDLSSEIASESYAEPFIEDLTARISAPEQDECNMCTMEFATHVDKAFDGKSLIVLDSETVESHDNGEAVYNYRTYYIDKSSNQYVEFLDLFDPSTTPFAKNAIVKAIMNELTSLNNAVNGNENGETQYFWNGMEANLQELGDEEWNALGLFPNVEDGLITSFTYQSDSYEFAPYGSSRYFSGFTIDAAPIVAFLKPAYRANFR